MVVYIESPYQLVNAIKLIDSNEFVNLNSSEFTFLIRDNGSLNQVTQYKEIVNGSANTNNYKFIKIERDSIKKYYKFIYAIFKIVMKVYKTKILIVGDVRSPIVKPFLLVINLLKLKVYLVDDGLYLARYIKKLSRLNINVFTSLPLEKSITGKTLRLIKNEGDLFSTYQAGLHKVFIGQNLVELGFLTEDDYILGLEQFYRRPFKGIDRALYYPHRYENEEKLKRIKSIGFEIVILNKPMEQEFSENGAPDGVFASFYSTALLNIKNMHRGGFFYYLDSDTFICDESVKEDIKVCHSLMEGSGINKFKMEV